MAEVLQKQKTITKDILSSINKNVQFNQVGPKYDIQIKYDPNKASISLTFTQTHPTSTIYKQTFTEENIKTITKKCEILPEHLYELLSVQFSSKKSTTKCFRLYKHSNLNILTEKYTQYQQSPILPEPDLSSIAQLPPANAMNMNMNMNIIANMNNNECNSSEDESELEFDVDGLLQEFGHASPSPSLLSNGHYSNNQDTNRESVNINLPQTTLTSAQSSTELPLGWAKLKDDDGFYYFNVLTSKKQRDRPTIPTAEKPKRKNTQKHKKPPKQGYLLCVFHFSPSKFVNVNYCFILKQQTETMDVRIATDIAIVPPFRSPHSFRVECIRYKVHALCTSSQ